MKLSKSDWTILIGNIIDHFDTSLYVFLAPIFAPVFFPNDDPIISLIMAYGLLVTSIFTKPFGTYIFSLIAKKYTAQIALSYSLIGIGTFTLLIGVLPSYDTIGIASPLLLVIIRILGEIFGSGENAIAKLYILDNKTGKAALKSSYLYQSSTILGPLLASLATTLVQYMNNVDYLWRVFFIIGGMSAIVGYVMRADFYKIHYAKIETKALKFYGVESVSILWKNKEKISLIAIVNGFSYMTYAIAFISINNLVPLVNNIKEIDLISTNNTLLIFDLLAIFVLGKLLTNCDPAKIMLNSSMILSFTIIPLWYFIEYSSIYYVIFVKIWIIIFGVAFLCPLNIWCKNQVPQEEKYLLVGIGSSIGAGLIGKLTPFISLLIYHLTGSFFAVSFYIASIFFTTFYVITKFSRY